MTVHATTAGKEGADKARQGKARSSDVDGQEEEEKEAQKLRGMMMRASYRDYQESWRGLYPWSELRAVRGVQANGLGGQNGYHVPEKERLGGKVWFTFTAASRAYEKKRPTLCIRGEAIGADRRGPRRYNINSIFWPKYFPQHRSCRISLESNL